MIDLLSVLGRLVAPEPAQPDLLGRLCDRPLIDAATVAASRPPPQPHPKVEGKKRSKVKMITQGDLI